MASLVAKKDTGRKPPVQLMNNEITATNAWCRYDPFACITQVGIETLFIAAAYVSVLLMLGNDVPEITNVAKFMGIFAFLTFSARMISDTLSDKMTITATAALGTKMMTLIAPKIVSW